MAPNFLTPDTNPSMHLHQVLAAEFAALHGHAAPLGSDLPVPDFDLRPQRSERAEPARPRVCGFGKIKYSAVDGAGIYDGELAYIKPSCCGQGPRDIYEYFKNHAAFPQEPASDQFFSESQFESYRMLGIHSMEKVCPDSVGDFKSFLKGVRKYLAASAQEKPETPDEPKTSPPSCD
jgi:hypothetical protein